MKFGRNTLKALISNCMGFAQTVLWLHVFGYTLSVSYPLICAFVTVPIGNAFMFRGIDKILDRKKKTEIILSDPICAISVKLCNKCGRDTRHGGPTSSICLECWEEDCPECGWVHNCPQDHHGACLHK